MPWLGRLVAGLSLRRLGFDPRSVSLASLVDRYVLGQVFLRELQCFPLFIIPPVLRTHFLLRTQILLLPGEHSWEALQPRKKQWCSGNFSALDRKLLSLSLRRVYCLFHVLVCRWFTKRPQWHFCLFHWRFNSNYECLDNKCLPRKRRSKSWKGET